jgi:competence protein ComEC
MISWRRSIHSSTANAKRTIAKPGDRISVAGLDVQVVTPLARLSKRHLPSAGAPTPYSASLKPGPNNAEDLMSVGIYVTFGKCRTIHLGDLTKNKELKLMCPNNRIGAIDLFLGLRHGSNSEVMIRATHPSVAIMNNGTRKGGEPDPMQVLSGRTDAAIHPRGAP